MEKQHHLQLLPGDIGETVFIPGDVSRAKVIADHFDEAKLVAHSRQYITYTGTYKGVKVSTTSTGIGCPAVAIAIEELIKVGAKNIIRIGTGGMIQTWLPVPAIMVITGAVRGDGTSREYFPLEYPAVADFHTVEFLLKSAEERHIKVFAGYERCHDAFYAESTFAEIDYLARDKPWIDSGVLITSNESGTVLPLTMVRGVRGGTILCSGGSHQRPDLHATEEEMKKCISDAIMISLDTAVKLHALDHGNK